MDAKSALVQFKKASLCLLGDDRTLIRTEHSDQCFIYQSFGKRESSFGDVMIEPHVSFLADNGNGQAAEWEPRYGPIQIWTECDADWKGEDVLGGEAVARAHWHFSFVEGTFGNWSQQAVDRERLKDKLLSGDIDAVFEVLARWANH